jgi:hypothetical protein
LPVGLQKVKIGIAKFWCEKSGHPGLQAKSVDGEIYLAVEFVDSDP